MLQNPRRNVIRSLILRGPFTRRGCQTVEGRYGSIGKRREGFLGFSSCTSCYPIAIESWKG